MYTNKFLLLVILLVLNACKSDESTSKLTTETKDSANNISAENLNVSFLLDLSDRIDPRKYPNPAMEYYLRDAGYITSVADAFTNHIKKKRIVQVNEKIQLFFDPEPLNTKINDIANSLKFAIDKNNISKELMSEIEDTYKTQPIKIYQLAIEDGKSQKYLGSKTWNFFKNKVKNNCIENDKRNILVILTDGYIYHEDNKIREGNKTTYLTPEFVRNAKLNSSDWQTKFEEQGYGFIPATNDLSNLEVLVLGINPNVKNAYEEDLIRKYWGDWLTKMNVKKFKIENADLPTNMDKIIKDFI